jgi:hypothetical protein
VRVLLRNENHYLSTALLTNQNRIHEKLKINFLECIPQLVQDLLLLPSI